MKILVGVCGGIASYKAAEIVRSLQELGADVEVTMTSSAQRFITPLTFQALTGKRVYTSLWDTPQDPRLQDSTGSIEHISVAQTIDALLVAPATANTIARFAHGIADDFLSTVYLATAAPTVLAPAMNVNMWQHPATQANLDLLRARGTRLIEPDSGYLACGMTGAGRLAPVERIVTSTLDLLSGTQDLREATILITAGGTREAIDPVRFLGNRSSGRMGHALAEAAIARGAKVILITASDLLAPAGCDAVRVRSAEEMWTAITRRLPEATQVFMAAAVADFRPIAVSRSKLRRSGHLDLRLEPTPDLVARIVAERRPNTIVIAFAAETEDLEINARAKLRRKGVDAIFANDISRPDLGFESDQNAGLFITADRTTPIDPSSKRVVADRLLDLAQQLRDGSSHGRNSILLEPEPAHR